MPHVGGLDGWLKPSNTSKRKRAVEVEDDVHILEKENGDGKPPKKKRPGTKQKLAAKTGTTAKQAKKLYSETLKALDKEISKLDKRVRTMDRNSIFAINTCTYADEASEHLPAAMELAHLDTTLAFNLLLSIADASHADLNVSIKMSGYDESSSDVFRTLDVVLLPLIEGRAKPTAHIETLPSVPHRWTNQDADVGEFKTGRPNKQQRGQMYCQKLEWEKERREARRERREEVEDWVKVALSDLVEERDYLAKYGVENYLPKSIARLEAVAAERVA